MSSKPPKIRQPQVRPLKVYAFDPSAGKHMGNEMTLRVPYERLHPGGPPVGNKVAVIDYDLTNSCFYTPVDLEDNRVLIRGGLDPSESDPRFHQQMVYAVVMDTVQRFEAALGRRIHWRRADRLEQSAEEAASGNIWRLKLFPHAMAEANAFYSPEAQGILFGYFRADETTPGKNLPGQIVYTCLSHDIIVHETTHAVIDGIRKYFTDPTNKDVAAFHEAFADLAALFRHFSHKYVLLDAIRKTGGRLFDIYLETDSRLRTNAGAAAAGEASGPKLTQFEIAERNPLIGLARQFGDATGRNSELRSALGTPASPKDYATKFEPHERGSILVAAVFDAYFTIYMQRTAPLFDIYRAGGGLLDRNDPYVPAPLAEQLAAEASRTAEEFFRVCARALDYCPPVDITFGDFLRAVLTAHTDLFVEDADGIRDAFMQSFRLRGIVPEGAAAFTENALRWEERTEHDKDLPRVEGLSFSEPIGGYKKDNDQRATVLKTYAKTNAVTLGFDPALDIDAASFHRVSRFGPDGMIRTDMIVELVQVREEPFDVSTPELGTFPFRGGATLIIANSGAQEPLVRYVIPKQIIGDDAVRRLARQRQFYMGSGYVEGSAADTKRFQIDFALIHGGF